MWEVKKVTGRAKQGEGRGTNREKIYAREWSKSERGVNGEMKEKGEGKRKKWPEK